ncbi:MAG: tRNA (5-methylaminomethyl-2-thiouridylate)-methyltransferase [Bacteroidetes bacterium]|nr:tRNA (5-methylaminomethyl-2-thiouridylate)-methyltransferase [Bacteroidota bacterium]
MEIAALVSGGVDSSVIVYNLKEMGYNPTLFYIKIGMEDEAGNIQCTTEDDLFVVQFLAKKYGLKMEEVSLHEEYWDNVVAYTIESVKRGLTPNPDMMCNRWIKFGYFEQKWGKEFDKIASGHYATTTNIEEQLYLSTAKDRVKDQTYFLAQINSLQLSKLMFPIGHLLKSEVRQIATSENLPSATRKDSQGICFLGKIQYNDFIKRYLGVKKGKIIEFETGKILGEHDGYWFHTIGQRKGLRLSGGPWFVIQKNIEENILFVSCGYDPATQYGDVINLSGFQFITDPNWGDFEEQEIQFKIRHTPDFTPGILKRIGDIYRIESKEKVSGIAAGQFGVIYDREKRLCFGSGVIV